MGNSLTLLSRVDLQEQSDFLEKAFKRSCKFPWGHLWPMECFLREHVAVRSSKLPRGGLCANEKSDKNISHATRLQLVVSHVWTLSCVIRERAHALSNGICL